MSVRITALPTVFLACVFLVLGGCEPQIYEDDDTSGDDDASGDDDDDDDDDDSAGDDDDSAGDDDDSAGDDDTSGDDDDSSPSGLACPGTELACNSPASGTTVGVDSAVDAWGATGWGKGDYSGGEAVYVFTAAAAGSVDFALEGAGSDADLDFFALSSCGTDAGSCLGSSTNSGCPCRMSSHARMGTFIYYFQISIVECDSEFL